MRVDLTGIHRVPMKLAGGREVVYWYAWRKGPRLKGEPGSPEFIASYYAAHETGKQPKGDTFQSVIAAFKVSKTGLGRVRDRTRKDYLRHIASIEIAFGDLPLGAFDDVRVTKDLLEWRDKLAERSDRQADYAWSVLMRLISFARGRGMTKYRLPEQVDRLYTPDRSDKVWTDEHFAAFVKVAAAPLQQAMILALETAQREGDLLTLPWSAYGSDERGKCIRLRPSKSKTRTNPQGRLVRVPVTATLANMLDRMPRISTQILTSEKGRPWNPKGNGFRSSWQKACKRAGISGLTFHDLRGTAITRLSKVYTPQEIAQWTGQSVRDIQNMIERYLARTSAEAPDVTKIGRGISRT